MLLPAMGVVREKEIGTLEQLIVTPIRPWQLIVGKLCPFAVIGLVHLFAGDRVDGLRLRGPAPRLVPAPAAADAPFLLSTLGLGCLCRPSSAPSSRR